MDSRNAPNMAHNRRGTQMSNAVIPADKVVTISKSAQKVIVSAPAQELVTRAVPHSDTTMIKPSDIKMADSVANVALGGKSSADAFVRALLFKTVRLAWGATKLDAAVKDLPEFAVFAVKTAHGELMGTKGITAGELRRIVVKAFDLTAALPIKAKVETDKSPSKVEVIAPTQEPDETPALVEAQKRAERILNMRHMQALNEKAGILLDFQRMEERDAERVRAMENTVAYRVESARKAVQAVDEAVLREILAGMGYELRRKPVKKAA